MKAKLIIAAVTILALASSAQAAEIKLLASSAIKETYLELLPLFEKATGHKVTAAWSSTPDIQKRIAAGEAADLVILGDSGTEELIKQGKLAANSRANFANSGIAVAVRRRRVLAGHPQHVLGVRGSGRKRRQRDKARGKPQSEVPVPKFPAHCGPSQAHADSGVYCPPL